MTAKSLADGSDFRATVTLAICIGLITTIIYSLRFSDHAVLFSPFYGYAVVLSCSMFGAFRPAQATLAALILVSVNPGFPVAHTFTSAPSDYLMASATASFIVRGKVEWVDCKLVIFGALLLCSGLTTLLVVGLFGGYEANVGKLFVAEYLGILSMVGYVLAPVLAAQFAGGARQIFAALAVGGVLLLVAGALGGIDTIACVTDGTEHVYSTAGFRTKGLLGDPNMFAAYLAALSPFLIIFFWRRNFTVAVGIVVACGVLLVLSGSRTGVAAGCVAIAASGVLADRSRRWIVPLCIMAGLAIVSAPKIFWPSLPCLFDVPDSRVSFLERNDGGAYFARMTVEAEGIERILKESSDIRNACDVIGRGEGTEALIRECVASKLASTFVSPVTYTGKFRTVPELRYWIDALPLDESRKRLWEHSLSIGLEKPFVGVGLANLPAMTPNGWRSHNTVLTTFAEQGVFGLVILFSTISFIVAAGIRGMPKLTPECRPLYRALSIGILVCLVAGLSQDFIRQPICWALLGVFATACVQRSSIGESTQDGSQRT